VNSSYYVFISTRNHHRDLKASITSLRWQSLPPTGILIFDNGSNPPLDQVFLNGGNSIDFAYGDDGVYDTRNFVHYWNTCLSRLKERYRIEKFDFTLISADDCIYPFDYAERILGDMMREDVKIASGNRGVAKAPDGWKAPEGAGRFVSSDFWEQVSWHIPETIGYEPWMFYEAMRLGMKVKAYDVPYWHFRPLGGVHRFVEWGHTAHMLGYYPPLFLARVGKNFLSRSIPLSGNLRMLRIYLKDFIQPPEGSFYTPFSRDLRDFVREFQKNRLKVALRTLL
jgi:hypothetical protein